MTIWQAVLTDAISQQDNNSKDMYNYILCQSVSLVVKADRF